MDEESEAVETHLDCPNCGHKKCGTLFSSGYFYCHSCGYKEKSGDTMTETVELPKGIHSGPLKERGISADTAKKFQVSHDKEPYKHYYPYYYLDSDGYKTTGKGASKVRVVEDKEFYVKGSINRCGLFGQNVFLPGSTASADSRRSSSIEDLTIETNSRPDGVHTPPGAMNSRQFDSDQTPPPSQRAESRRTQ